MDSPLFSAPFYCVSKKKKDGNTTANTQATGLRFVIQADSDRESLRGQLLEAFEFILAFCEKSLRDDFDGFEKSLIKLVRSLGCLLVAYFMWNRHRCFDHGSYARRNPGGRFKIARSRCLRCWFGGLTYSRCYYEMPRGRGHYPLDFELGLVADGFSPKVISLVTRLATRLSFSSARLVCDYSLGWAPSQRTIEELVLPVGEYASQYMEEMPPPVHASGSEIVVIEIDGKATPTATEQELEKRRGKRSSKKGCHCCQRHRGKDCRRRRGKRKRRKKGDKTKNGRSITIVAVYTLKRGEDGKLHGPENKRIWGSYASRKWMLDWAKAEVERRGFRADGENVHFLSDGELALNKGLEERFPNATKALDIRHIEEKIWNVGNLFYKEGSAELEKWVEKQKKPLYEGNTDLLLKRLKRMLADVSARGPGTKRKREKLTAVINYIEKRPEWMRYGKLREQDLVIATGIIEGAARYVIGERLDCSGMRWIEERAEMLLHLRCIEVNGEWDRFFNWTYSKLKLEQLQACRARRLRSNTARPLPIAA